MAYFKFFEENWTTTTCSYLIRLRDERRPNILPKNSTFYALETILDSGRIAGVTSSMDDDMKRISRALDDHYAVRAVGKISSITVVFLLCDLLECRQLNV